MILYQIIKDRNYFFIKLYWCVCVCVKMHGVMNFNMNLSTKTLLFLRNFLIMCLIPLKKFRNLVMKSFIQSDYEN